MRVIYSKIESSISFFNSFFSSFFNSFFISSVNSNGTGFCDYDSDSDYDFLTKETFSGGLEEEADGSDSSSSSSSEDSSDLLDVSCTVSVTPSSTLPIVSNSFWGSFYSSWIYLGDSSSDVPASSTLSLSDNSSTFSSSIFGFVFCFWRPPSSTSYTSISLISMAASSILLDFFFTLSTSSSTSSDFFLCLELLFFLSLSFFLAGSSSSGSSLSFLCFVLFLLSAGAILPMS